MEEEHLLSLTHSESYLLEKLKLEFQERKEERDREHMKVMAKIELEIAKLRNGRTFFSG